MFTWLFGSTRTFGKTRSSKWPTVRAAHLKRQPACAACGCTSPVEVHHIRPFHLFPEMELDPANLITLCESKSHNCHLLFGHCLNWRKYNPQVCPDAAACLAMLRQARGPAEKT